MIDLTEELKATAAPGMQLPPLRVDPAAIRTVMINEVVPECPENDFYGSAPAPLYLSTALPLFRQAGFPASSIHDVTDAGIYITNAIKTPKKGNHGSAGHDRREPPGAGTGIVPFSESPRRHADG